MEQARLIVDEPLKGTVNMAIDQALLNSANDSNQITLRFYRWSEPTLTLGYFQRYTDRTSHADSLGCPVVRRKTGGGAILHDQELTYSLCIPSRNRWSTQNSEMYELVHDVIIEQLKKFGVRSQLFRNELETQEGTGSDLNEIAPPTIDAHAFMCFSRRSPGDITCRGHKIVGSAQRRLKNALLQHGSILIRKSSHAPSLLGIEELNDASIDIGKLIELLSQTIEASMGFELNRGVLTETENESLKNQYLNDFESESWNRRR